MSLMERYNEPYLVQEYTLIDNPFPPFRPPQIPTFGDGCEVIGAFKQSKSDEVRIADAQGIKTDGLFVTSAKLESGVTLRRPRDNAWFKIIGEPQEGKPITLPDMNVYSMRLTSRSEEYDEVVKELGLDKVEVEA